MEEQKRFNSRKGDKKISLLLVLKVLERWSSAEHPVQQAQLVEYVNNCNTDANVWCDRKTVGRHLKVLKQAGYPIECIKGKGWYLERNGLSYEECDLLLDLLADNRSEISTEQKQAIIAKLTFQKAYLLNAKML